MYASLVATRRTRSDGKHAAGRPASKRLSLPLPGPTSSARDGPLPGLGRSPVLPGTVPSPARPGPGRYPTRTLSRLRRRTNHGAHCGRRNSFPSSPGAPLSGDFWRVCEGECGTFVPRTSPPEITVAGICPSPNHNPNPNRNNPNHNFKQLPYNGKP